VAKDKYDQFMFLSVEMSAANTLTFGEVGIGGAVFEYAALVFSRIEYYPSYGVYSELTANADTVDFALTGSDGLADLSIDKPQVYDRASINVNVSGAPAVSNLVNLPIIHDFTQMSGGGIMVPAQTLYVGMVSAGFAAAHTVSVRAYYRIEKLVAADFVELVQRYRILST